MLGFRRAGGLGVRIYRIQGFGCSKLVTSLVPSEIRLKSSF